ncbi:immune inhibitor A domain-containing protein [Nocardioides mesophilus]|uniref:Immune inhibitor A n=1 Tax=Nocardioides mesophilus TaxID=433659 RepID=A0A7G9RA23_9ACTN|nr:immune inhibitor A domain-containing protein [Nocardioides mesophilus]QNN52448.1 immune inhibitor A [Nocardioides mesophilus]
MKRRSLGVLSGAATAALLATAIPAPAIAVPPADPGQQAANGKTKTDDRADPLSTKQRALNKRAVELVLAGKAEPRNRGGSKSVRVAPGQWAQYGLQSQDELFSILVEFGGNATGSTTAGPLHNQIPKPDRSSDNSTYWIPDFNRQHYLDMFFNGLPEQNGESFKDFYEEASSGRYTVNGDVSDWVKVDKPEAAYGTTESQKDMTSFIDDTAEAWYAAQVKAGKSTAEIADYLTRFDQWDRFDSDGDGVFAEPDGYVDHFQAIHAGEGEEAGAPESTIWSHRWAVGVNGRGPDGAGPDGYTKNGGIEIGDTGVWIRDYTTEPENGGLGVFAHEFGHDLGLPDLYDTAGGDNGTGFWTLMSSGSWLGHGKDSIGTTPGHMDPWSKLMLGWLDYEVADADTKSTHHLGPAAHATKKAQALLVNLPDGTKVTDIGPAATGNDYFYSGRGDDRVATVTSPEFTVPASGALTANVRYEIEKDWDYAYAEVSADGSTWTPLATNRSTTTNPYGSNEGHGITGSTKGWVPLTADLSSWAGKQVQVRFRMVNDPGTNELGFLVDDIAVGSALTEGAENGAPGWKLDKFVIAENGKTSETFQHHYLVENRQYLGYDQTLQQGPYNFGWSKTEPNRVEHFPYQDGMLVWYWNDLYADNNTSTHPGGGLVLPVDARGEALAWSDGTVARNRIQAFDATFGLERTDALSLHRETEDGMTTLEVPARAAAPVFDDTHGERYWDEANEQGSVQVPDTGTQIKVVNSNRNGMMQVQVY